MQDQYFQPWLGTWPTAIDWTAAVMGTHVSGALSTISRALDLLPGIDRWAHMGRENTVTLFFSQILGFYFGQDSFAIRNEAYDDILWVVLGWLETIQFIDLHTSVVSGQAFVATGEYLGQHGFEKWHGNIWVPAFAHRSRIFWNLAKTGWDSDLCGGGMVWNPRLEPYKNAITNQLFVSASASMHLYFPGDGNRSPFLTDAETTSPESPVRPSAQDVFEPQDPAFLHFAKTGYDWLQTSAMMNDKGLYVDGFHISGWNDPTSTNKMCDVRNEQVYTYNQGVILTGQLNLWKITGNYSYVQDGHQLIQSVIRATGWDLDAQRPTDHDIPHAHDPFRWRGTKLPRWHGLGRAGVLEEACDSRGDCSQDAQTFKGIFLHHLTTFCAAPPLSEAAPQRDLHHHRRHARACRAYLPWLAHNRRAMLRTRDRAGRVGMWWTAGLLGLGGDEMPPPGDDDVVVVPGAVDYRNRGVPDDPVWRRRGAPIMPPGAPLRRDDGGDANGAESDMNDRGRGRTVETQGGGLALLRACWEIEVGLGRDGAPRRPAGGDEL